MVALALRAEQPPQQSDCREAVYRCGGRGNAEDHQRAHPNGQGCGVRVMKSNTFEKVFSDFIVYSTVKSTNLGIEVTKEQKPYKTLGFIRNYILNE